MERDLKKLSTRRASGQCLPSGPDDKREMYVPYQPALDSGISPEMDRLNFRRIQLAERKARGQLTREEEAEFEKLKDEFFAYIATIFPRPSILSDERLEKLEAKYDVKHP